MNALTKIELISDKEIAECLKLSTAWVRKQRYLRRHGRDHLLDLDPIYIGNTPRYLKADFMAWLARMRELGSCLGHCI